MKARTTLVLLAAGTMLGATALGLDPEKKPEPPKPATPAQPDKPAGEGQTPTTKPQTPAEAKPDAKPTTQPVTKPQADAAKPDPFVLGYNVKSIDGRDVKLDIYRGKVLLIVNVASKCGYTHQYAGLEKLYKEKESKGLVVLGFPANNFGGQEPGTNKEILEFCKSKYEVTFPMFEKISVKDDDCHPLFKHLAALQGEPRWNFTKYLVDREGKLVAKYESRTKPDDSEFVKKVDELLSRK